jgi:2-oxoglutarate dehydrogenase E1 component
MTVSRASPLTRERLRELNEALLTWPAEFTLNRRLERPLERRRAAFGPEGSVDWAHAESLAFATILTEGTPIRLTGQDVERGTFSQRHLVLHDAETGVRYTPLQSLASSRASFAVYNSPLSENAPLGFEYGYSVHSPTVMVIWEAQFGDFVNAGQVIVDQFIATARAKWRQSHGLVLLLPHGLEGQGPEHSSGRVERFLQLTAGDNMGVVNCTTAAQYFHLLRCQAARLKPGPTWSPHPLVVMSPKSLLRHPLAASTVDELAHGAFQPLIDEGPPVTIGEGRKETAVAIYQEGQVLPRLNRGALRVPVDARRAVTRLVLCSGKVAVDLAESPARPAAAFVAVARVEELHPFPRVDLEEVLARYPHLREVVWVQEEPENMGAWSYVAPRLWAITERGVEVRLIARPRRSSPAVGSALRHSAEQASIIAQAFEDRSRAKDSRAERLTAATREG